MANTHEIEITEKKFPEKTEIAAGDTVVWTNKMNMNHTVTADNGGFDSGNFGLDESFSHTFSKAGEYPYHCERHPKEMKGKVIAS